MEIGDNWRQNVLAPWWCQRENYRYSTPEAHRNQTYRKPRSDYDVPTAFTQPYTTGKSLNYYGATSTLEESRKYEHHKASPKPTLQTGSRKLGTFIKLKNNIMQQLDAKESIAAVRIKQITSHTSNRYQRTSPIKTNMIWLTNSCTLSFLHMDTWGNSEVKRKLKGDIAFFSRQDT